MVDDDVVEVGAADALSDRLNRVGRKGGTQERFDLALPCLTLQLLGALLRPALEILDLPA